MKNLIYSLFPCLCPALFMFSGTRNASVRHVAPNNNGETKFAFHNFGRPFSLLTPTRTFQAYQFDFELWLTGDDFNYFYTCIHKWIINKDPDEGGDLRYNTFKRMFVPAIHILFNSYNTFKYKI